MDINLNLATEPYQQVQRLLVRWKLIIAGVALLAVLLVVGSLEAFLSWRTIIAQVAGLERQIAEQDRTKAQAEAFLDRPDNLQLRRRAELLNAAIARKAFSWTEIFTDLEKIMPAHLHVTAIHPSVNNDDQLELRLTVSGRDRQDGIELMRRFAQSSHFTQAQIVDENSESPQKGQGTGDVIQYNLSAVYIPGFARKESDRAGARTEKPAMPGDRREMKEAADAGH